MFRGEFNITKLLTDLLGYKGIPYPGVFFPPKKKPGQSEEYEVDTPAPERNTHSDTGSLLWKEYAPGKWYFMPVELEHQGETYELPNAVISIVGKKQIVSTPMVGRNGTVKELISIDDYDIHIISIVIADQWPELEIARIEDLYTINESVKLNCALTNLFIPEGDVVIKSIDVQEMRGNETAQIIKLSLVSDQNFELEIK